MKVKHIILAFSFTAICQMQLNASTNLITQVVSISDANGDPVRVTHFFYIDKWNITVVNVIINGEQYHLLLKGNHTLQEMLKLYGDGKIQPTPGFF